MKIYHFSSEIFFTNVYTHFAIFSCHTGYYIKIARSEYTFPDNETCFVCVCDKPQFTKCSPWDCLIGNLSWYRFHNLTRTPIFRQKHEKTDSFWKLEQSSRMLSHKFWNVSLREREKRVTVWQDWAIFKGLGGNFIDKSSPNIWEIYGLLKKYCFN